MKKSTKPVGQIIKEYRQKSGMTQMDLADKLGYDIPQFISLMENGHSKVPLNVLGQIISYLSIPEKVIMESLLDAYEKEAKQQITSGKKKAG